MGVDSPFTVWGPGIQFRSPDLTESPPTLCTWFKVTNYSVDAGFIGIRVRMRSRLGSQHSPLALVTLVEEMEEQ